ncbi:MAG: hypothetical protein AB8H79_17510 [Myxococcota bacterium]
MANYVSLIRREAGTDVFQSMSSFSELVLGAWCIADPAWLLAMFDEEAEDKLGEHPGQWLLVDRKKRRAILYSPDMAPESDDDVVRSVMIGLWAWYGWKLQVTDSSTVPKTWPRSKKRKPLTYAQAGRAWHVIANQWDVCIRADDYRSTQLYGRNATVEEGPTPCLLRQGGTALETADPLSVLFAFGAAHAAGFVDDSGNLAATADITRWKSPKRHRVNWDQLATQPDSLVAALANRNDESEDEMRFGLADGIESEMRRRGWHKPDWFAMLAALEPEQQKVVTTAVRKLFKEAGMA